MTFTSSSTAENFFKLGLPWPEGCRAASIGPVTTATLKELGHAPSITAKTHDINGLVEAIVILPRNMFYSTDISVTLWILAGNRKARTVEQNGELVKYRNRENEVLFIDLRQWGEPFEKKYIQFTQEQISQIAENFHHWQREGYEQTYRNVPEYCYSATLEEIEAKGWSLVPSKYIEFKSRDEGIDFDSKMKELQAEMRELLKQEEESKKDLLNLFRKLGYGIE